MLPFDDKQIRLAMKKMGINIKEFSPLFKSEILEFGYTRWLNNKYGSK